MNRTFTLSTTPAAPDVPAEENFHLHADTPRDSAPHVALASLAILVFLAALGALGLG